MPGRRIFTATGLRSAVDFDFRAVHLRDRRGGDGGTEARIGRVQRLVQRGSDDGFRLGLRERRHLVLQALEIARDRVPTTSGRVARNWPSLT